eukprot:scaffold840_cov29-Prasinocladus_malaysianus.AAC.1
MTPNSSSHYTNPVVVDWPQLQCGTSGKNCRTLHQGSSVSDLTFNQSHLGEQLGQLEAAKTAEQRFQAVSEELSSLHRAQWDTSEKLSQAEAQRTAMQRALRQVLLETMPARLLRARRTQVLKLLRARRSRDSVRLSALQKANKQLEARAIAAEKKLVVATR